MLSETGVDPRHKINWEDRSDLFALRRQIAGDRFNQSRSKTPFDPAA